MGCLLDSHPEALHLLHKLTPADNVEAYLYMFVQTAYRDGWPEEEWALLLASLLTGETPLAYFSLLLALVEDYSLLKEQILGHCGFSICQAMTERHHWVYQADINPHNQIGMLLRTTKSWLQFAQHSAIPVTGGGTGTHGLVTME